MNSALIIALALLGMCTLITVSVILKYPPDKFMKFWAAFGPVFGGLIGTIATYYFQANEVAKAKDTSASLAQSIVELQRTQGQVASELESLERKVTEAAAAGAAAPAGVSANVRALRQHFDSQSANLNMVVHSIPPDVLRRLAKPPH
jgi:predicted negative regulator of RcsB-dependent stress response